MEEFERKGEYIWIAEKRDLADIWLEWVITLLGLDENPKFIPEMSAAGGVFFSPVLSAKLKLAAMI